MSTKPKLTPEQRREVKSLIEDSGYTRKEAVAWVLAFPSTGVTTSRGSDPQK